MKKSAFFNNAKLLNEKLNIIPLMYGSLGLEYITNESLNADDIDILIPEFYLNECRDKFKIKGWDYMKLKLIKGTIEYKSQIIDMLKEWKAYGEKIIPCAIRRLDYTDFEYYCNNLEIKDDSEGLVPDSTFFCLDEERNIIVGAVNIRHYLNEGLLLNGGHIGDGVRPSERRKGIATKMISLALDECKRLGIKNVLMVCDKDNIGSAKSIINNGGILENEVDVDGIVEQRYWIKLN